MIETGKVVQGAATILTAAMFGCLFLATDGYGQEKGNVDLVPECQELRETSKKVEAMSREMLEESENRRVKVEGMREELGPDMAAELLKILTDERQRLEGTLREARAARCNPSSGESPRDK